MRLIPLIGVFTLTQAIRQTPAANLSLAANQTSDLKVVLLADTNRDGKVDVTGDSDRAGKETWTAESGALFLANIADTDRRCSSQITGKCAADLGNIFRDNFVPLPEPTVLGKPWNTLKKELVALKESNDKKDNEKFKVVLASPEYAADFNERAKWQWAKSDGALIATCHDASDDVLRNPAVLAPLRTVPSPELSAEAIGSITVSDEAAASNVRIFHKKGGSWVYVGPDYAFSAGDMRAGLELGLDGRDVRRPNRWDGRALVKFTVRDRGREATDSVALRVAPVLTHHHGQLAEQLLVLNNGRPRDEQFVKELKAVSDRAGVKSPVHVIDSKECRSSMGYLIWTQDFFEPAYTSIPGPDGPVGLRVMIRSSEGSRAVGRLLFQELRSDTVGVVQHLETGKEGGSSEATGNLETIPPYTHNGKAYPVGRTIMGSSPDEQPTMLAFLEAQEVQKPLQLDTSWLAVGHVDEFLQFLPAKSKRGWVMVVDDPKAGLGLLQEAQKASHGAVKAVSRSGIPSDRNNTCTPADTIDQVLEKLDLVAAQETSAKAIQKNIDLIKQETGITDAEIIRLPALYYPYYAPYVHWRCEKKAQGRQRGLEARAEKSPSEIETENILGGLDQIPVSWDGAPPAQLQHRASPNLRNLIALYPGMINGVVLSDSKVLAPNPWGPVIDGKDMLIEAANAAYAKANFTVEYMDDWFTHHVDMGEIHCGTNTIRETTGQWW